MRFSLDRINCTVILVSALALASCSTAEENNDGVRPPDVACTMEARAAINVTPLDNSTGKAVTGSTTLIIQDGAYADTVRATIDGSNPALALSGAYERAGNYAVTVRNPAYQDWTRTGVMVTRDVCHVQPVSIEARMSKKP